MTPENNTPDLAALREVAEKAKDHGRRGRRSDVPPLDVCDCAVARDWNLSFNPSTVLALLDEVERLRVDVARLLSTREEPY